MGGTKIIVLHVKELIRTGIFALIGIVLIIAMVLFFMPKNNTEQSLYTPGTYTEQIVLHNAPVDVKVTVSDFEILDVSLENMAEIQEVFYPLMQPTMDALAQQIVEKQSLEVDLSGENQVTSQILLGAVKKALDQAQ